MMNENNEHGNIYGKIESILYVAGEPVEMDDLARAIQETPDQTQKAVGVLRDRYNFDQSGFIIKRFGSKVQLGTRSIYSEDIVRLLQPVQKQSLTQAALETLAIVAYRQPVTRAEIEAVRGVKCDYSLQNLTLKGLICEVGRKDTLGKPILFGTTDAFLDHFGLQSLEDLPDLPEQCIEQK